MSETAQADIEIAVARKDGASRTYAVTVSADRVRAAEAATTARYRQQVQLPGFRKGQAPDVVVRRRFGDAIRQATIEELLRESWERARTQESLKPVGGPFVQNLKFEVGTPLTFELQVDVKPEIALARVGGFRLARRTAAVTDEMVAAQLTQLREQKAPWVPLTARAKPGDLVEATVTNLDEASDAAPQSVRFVLGQGRALPDLEAHIMALDPGGVFEGAVRFPDDHPDPDKRGTSRRVRLALLEVKRQVPRDLTDDFAREVGDFDSVDALRRGVRADLEAETRREAEARLRNELIEQLAAANNVAVPPSLLERALAAYGAAYGIPPEQLERFAAEFRPVAEATVRRDLIIDAVAEQAKLTATEAELDERIAQLAARRGEQPGAVYAALEKAGRLREVERSITEDKVFAHLVALSSVEDLTGAR